MAKPIELGLTLSGSDARRFNRYMKHPTYPKKAREMLKNAAKRAEYKTD